MGREIESILVDLRSALSRAEHELREAKAIPLPPPRRQYTNADEARAWAGNALAYANGTGPDDFKVRIVTASLEKIEKLLADPAATNHEGPHQ